MKISFSKSKNSTNIYVIKSYWDPDKRKSTSKTIEKLGSPEYIKNKYNCEDPIEWARNRAAELTKLEKEDNIGVNINLSQTESIEKDIKRTFNGGYLFLQDIYYKLKINEICLSIQKKYKIKYNLNDIFSKLVYSRIIYPGSKLYTHQISQNYIEPGKFDLHQTYRALDIIAKETRYIESRLYKNSQKLYKRKTGVLYYDVTNYYFEINQEDDFRKYGLSKQHQPRPLVSMGLLMDLDGIPLSFNIEKGNEPEQKMLQPIEEKIINDYNVKKFVMCTDAGIASIDNRKFNTIEDRSYITVQSIKKLKKHLKEYCLDASGWHLKKSNKEYDIKKIENDDWLREKYYNCVFYKDRWICEDGFEQHLIVTFSFKYKDYARHVRQSQIDRAVKLKDDKSKYNHKKQNDPSRFIKEINVTKEGEAADNKHLKINQKKIEEEQKYDGFYALCTNLDDDPEMIIKANHNRWKIEKCFRDLKTEFFAGNIYLSNKERIIAHFTTCFVSLLLIRLLENKLNNNYSVEQISKTLRNYNFLRIDNDYIPEYTRTELIDNLHVKFGFNTAKEVVTSSKMKEIKKLTKHKNITIKSK